MRWLENPRDDSERLLRAGLDAATGRTDELALRRVWGRLAELPPILMRGSRWGYLLTGMAVAGGAAAALALLWPFARVAELPPAVSAASLPVPTAPAPELPPEPEQVLLGPTTVTTGAREARTVRLKGGTRVRLRAQTTLAVDAGQRPALQRGGVQVEVPHQTPGDSYTVAAGPYVIVVVGTTFDVAVDRGHVQVDVREGVVEVWRDGEMVRLLAGHSWRGPARMYQGARVPPAPRRHASVSPRPTAPPVPLPPHPADRFVAAKDALNAGDVAGALLILRELSAGTGPTAENSNYEIGRVLRDRRHQPRAALEVWNRYRERFPRGLLRAETDFSIIETLLDLGDLRLARAEAYQFLSRHPYSERREEITRLAEGLKRYEEGDRPSARARR